MKKLLNVFCVLMLALLLADIISSLVAGAPDFAQGFRDGYYGKELSAGDDLTDQWWFIVPISVLVVGFGGVAFVCFVRFVLNVNHDEVFTWENVGLLRWTGIGVAVTALCNTAIDLGNSVIVAQSLSNHIEFLIFGVFCLIMTEVFGIGLKLREEQDLTI